jgi:hypothetical protein
MLGSHALLEAFSELAAALGAEERTQLAQLPG